MLGIAVTASVHGCVGLGAWTLGTRTESSEQPKIEQIGGAINLRKADTDTNLKTAGNSERDGVSLTRLSNATTERKNGSMAPVAYGGPGWCCISSLSLCPRCFLSVHNPCRSSSTKAGSSKLPEEIGPSRLVPTADTSA